MTLPLAISAALGGTISDQSRRLGIARTQWSRLVGGHTAPTATSVEGWAARLLETEGRRLVVGYEPGKGWTAGVWA